MQTLSQINGEAPQWFGDGFGATFSGKTTTLPFDAHSIVALVAPRPIIVQEGKSDGWNNNRNGGPYQAVWAAREVFEALGIEDHIGWVADDHSHGVMTTREANAILGFAERFLLGGEIPARKGRDDGTMGRERQPADPLLVGAIDETRAVPAGKDRTALDRPSRTPSGARPDPAGRPSIRIDLSTGANSTLASLKKK
ncbi:hypothetical protein WME98_12105 [Sorangium sp. So ce296]|uniref:glucuronyl esterase domain-containing protein n=1 Tax=Sorangium sp. So ce296 TaxID=3133296 RepID=UPI003F5FDCA6